MEKTGPGPRRSHGTGDFCMRSPLSRGKRIALGLAGLAGVALVLLYMRLGGVGMTCPFYSLTGLYCPGCGSGRAVYLALHGHFAESFRYNPALYVLGIPAGLVLLHEYARLVFPRLGLRPIRVSRGVTLGVILALIAYWIARNLPVFSFLAPAG